RESPCARYRRRSLSIGKVPLDAILFHTRSSGSHDGKRYLRTRSVEPLPPHSRSPGVVRNVSDKPDRSRGTVAEAPSRKKSEVRRSGRRSFLPLPFVHSTGAVGTVVNAP